MIFDRVPPDRVLVTPHVLLSRRFPTAAGEYRTYPPEAVKRKSVGHGDYASAHSTHPALIGLAGPAWAMRAAPARTSPRQTAGEALTLLDSRPASEEGSCMDPARFPHALIPARLTRRTPAGRPSDGAQKGSFK